MNCDISPTSSENYHLPEDRLLKKAIHLKLCDHQGWLFKKVEWIFWSNQEIDNFQNFLDEPLLIVGRREKCPLNIPITLRELHNIKKEALSTVSKKLSLVSKRNIYYGGGGLNYHAKISRSAFFLSLSAKENGFTETELEVCENSLNAIPNDYDFYFAVKNLPESAYEEAHEIFIEKLYSRFSFSHLDVTKIFHYLKKIQTKLQQKTLDNPYLEKIFRNVDLQPNHPFLFKILLKVDAFSIRKINKDNNQFIFVNLGIKP